MLASFQLLVWNQLKPQFLWFENSGQGGLALPCTRVMTLREQSFRLFCPCLPVPYQVLKQLLVHGAPSPMQVLQLLMAKGMQHSNATTREEMVNASIMVWRGE